MKTRHHIAVTTALLSFLIATPAVAGDPGPHSLHARVAVHKAQKAMIEGDTKQAETLLAAYVQKHPDAREPMVYFVLGNICEKEAHHSDARKNYDLAVALMPDYTDAWQNRGVACMGLKNPEEAAVSFENAAECAPEDRKARLCYQAGACYLNADKPAKAEAVLTPLVRGQFGPPKIEWYEALLKAYIDRNRTQKGITLLENALREMPENAKLWKLLARLHLAEKAYRKAAVALQSYAYLTTPSREEKILLGDLYQLCRLPAEAAVWYRAAGNSPELIKKQAFSLLAAHEHDEAAQIIQEALNNETDPELWMLLGRIKYENSDFTAAYSAFQNARKAGVKFRGERFMLLGYCALKADKRDEAISAFKQAGKFKKFKKEAASYLSRIEKSDDREPYDI